VACGLRPDLWLHFESVRGFGLAFGCRFGLGVGLAFAAGGVLCADFPVGVVGRDTVRGLVHAGLQRVQAGRPVAGPTLGCGCF
jgi:hypothetical protein